MVELLQALLMLGLAAAPAQRTSAEVVAVIQGDLLLARVGNRQLLLEVAGVWVPAAKGVSNLEQYHGEDARNLTIRTLASGPVRIDYLASRSSDGLPQIRVRVGAEPARDLSVALAEAGFALADGPVPGQPELSAAITAAERRARRARAGLHDGGFRAFEANRPTLTDLGLRNYVLASQRADRELAATGGGVESASWDQPSEYRLHANPVSAIRDWGSSMGLPPDGSASGQ